MTTPPEHSPWMCHVCDYRSTSGEGRACSVCFKTTCDAHLRKVSVFNGETGLYEIRPVCLHCAVSGVMG